MKPQKIDFSILDQFSSLLSTISDEKNKVFLTLEHLKKFQTLKLQLEKITYVGMIYKENFHLEFFFTLFYQFLMNISSYFVEEIQINKVSSNFRKLIEKYAISWFFLFF